MVHSAALALFASLAHPAAAEAAKQRFIDVELIAEATQPKPGGTTLVALRMIPKPGWHSYWSNPGDAGFPTVVDWKAPRGVRFGPLRHPAPSLIQVAGMTSYVHEGPHVLLAQMSLDHDIPPGTAIPVTADVSWAACSEKLCVPERATLSLKLTAGDGVKSSEAPRLRSAFAQLPKRIDGGSFEVVDGKLILDLPKPVRLNADTVRFFPDENGFLDTSGARAVSRVPVRISLPLIGEVPKTLTGVVTDGASAYRLTMAKRATPLETATYGGADSTTETRRQSDSAKSIYRSGGTKRRPEAAREDKPEADGYGARALTRAALLALVSIVLVLVFLKGRRSRA